jgi:hypothetical protein
MAKVDTNKICEICGSALANEILERRNLGSKRLIKWAGARGLQFNEKQLVEHFAKHIQQNGANGNGQKTAGEKVTLVSVVADNKPDRQQLSEKAIPSPDHISTKQQSPPAAIGDEKFLNQIIEQVNSRIKSGELDLKVEHAFKAIELKQKFLESGSVETILLELLNEIRKQELVQV